MKAVDTVRRNPFYHCLEYDQNQLGDLYLIACGQEACDPGVTYGPYLRIGWHLHIVRSGKGILKSGGKTFTVREGQMFLLKHKETAEYTSDPKMPWSYCWVTFHGSEAEAFAEEIGFEKGVYVLDNPLGAEPFYELVHRMMQFPEMNAVSSLRRRGVLMEFLALAIEASGGHRIPRQTKPIDEYIRQAEDFIHYNYASMQVSDVIRYAGFTRAYFSTAFRKKTGFSVKDYLTNVRMEKAKILLKNTDLQIREISEKAGYPDPLHFSRAFRDWCGMSPSQYRHSLVPPESDKEE